MTNEERQHGFFMLGAKMVKQMELEKMKKLIKGFIEVYGAEAFEELAKTKGEYIGPVSHGLRLDPEQIKAINKQMRKKKIDELKALAKEL